MRTKMTLAAIVVAMFGAAFAGACGGSGGDPSATVEDFFSAVLDGDGAAACDLVTEDGLDIIGASTDGTSCEDAVEQAGPLVESTGIELVSAETTSEEGDTATVEATVSAMGEEDTSEITLVDEDGWKIASDGSE